MCGTFLINGEKVSPPAGISVSDPSTGEPLFKSYPRKKKLIHFVLHETAGRTAEGAKKTLLKKNLGVHLIIDRDGEVSCHGDLATTVMYHANQLNSTSIGIEIVNPYAPSIANKMNVNTVPADWWTWCPDPKDRRYVVPTEIQLATLEMLIPWLCNKLNIPYVFPTYDLNKDKRKIKGWRAPPLGWYAKPDPGVVAHQDFASHADGRYILEYLAHK